MNLVLCGKVIVTERLTYDIHAASKDNLFWELWRDLPEETIDGVKTEYTVKSVKQITSSGEEIIYDESPKLYWEDEDYVSSLYGPYHWFHSPGPYNEDYRDYECVFFYLDGVYRDELIFEIEYEMTNAALRYSDCSELYLCMYSEETIKHLKSFKGEVLIANEDMPSKKNYSATTYGTTNTKFDYRTSTTKNPGYFTFYFELDENDLKFDSYNEFLEFSLVSFGDDKHKFTNNASRNLYYYDTALDEIMEEQEEYIEEQEYNKKLQKTMTTLAIIVSAVITLITFIIYTVIKKKNTLYKPTMDFQFFREIPSDLDPNFVANLIRLKNNKAKIEDEDIYSSILLSLIRKKYIAVEKIDEMQDWDKNNVKLVLLFNPPEPEIIMTTETIITPEGEEQTIEKPVNNYDSILEYTKKFEPLYESEKIYLDLLTRHIPESKVISLSTLQAKIYTDSNYSTTISEKFDTVVTEIGTEKNYFQKADVLKPRKQISKLKSFYATISFIYLYFAIVFIGFNNEIGIQTSILVYATIFLNWICSNKAAKKIIPLTQLGEDEYAKWNGLYNFLNSETLINEKEVIDLVIWEKYLVYATAFGISDKVIKALKIRCPELEYNSTSMLGNQYISSSRFISQSRSIYRSVRLTSSYHGKFSGGYGGGGRGGGGGRWWTLIYKIKTLLLVEFFTFIFLNKKIFNINI